MDEEASGRPETGARVARVSVFCMRASRRYIGSIGAAIVGDFRMLFAVASAGSTMAVLEETKEGYVVTAQDKAREERKRTGRYIAAGTAIFLCLLGVYHALSRGTPEYAALFAPAVIMFVYVLWILYASKHYRRSFLIDDPVLTEVTSTTPPPQPPSPQPPSPMPPVAPSPKRPGRRPFNRSYSIA